MTKAEIAKALETSTPVYYYESWSENIIQARILRLDSNDACEYAKLENLDTTPGNADRQFKDIYASREELQAVLNAEENAKIDEIKEQIQTKEDLIRFMFDHTVAPCEEYTDWTARKAVCEIAKERWGLELN